MRNSRISLLSGSHTLIWTPNKPQKDKLNPPSLWAHTPSMKTLLFLILIINPASWLFSTTLGLGIIIATSSPTWFTRWIGLELNILSFIPLILSNRNSLSYEAGLKYFLIQALRSAVMLTRATLSLLIPTLPKIIILIALLLKIGAAPMHFWLPPIIQGLSWTQCIIIITLQKIAPMALISYTICEDSRTVIIISSILSAIAGGLGGLNQTLLRKIIAYSSINHIAWILAALLLGGQLWGSYLLNYRIISSSLVLLLNTNQIFHIKQIVRISASQFNKTTIFIRLFSLGGLPPFLGFIPKLLIASQIAAMNLIFWLTILVIRRLITLFYYTRISLIALTLNSCKANTSTENNNNKQAIFLFLNTIPVLIPVTLLLQF